MSKRTIFTTITPLPSHVTRETVIETLHSHTEMIDLNPLVIERHPIKPPGKATAEEFHCIWYSITDRISYLPGGMAKGKVTYNACFHNLANGLQTHVYAPAGLDIKEKWSVGGSLPGEPQQPTEIGQGIPLSGLYLREDIDMSCNFMMTGFVKKTLQAAHSKLIGRLVIKTQLTEKDIDMERMTQGSMSSGPPTPHLNYAGSLHGSPHQPSDGMMSPGFPSPGFQNGPAGHLNDPRMSIQSVGSSSGIYSSFASPAMGMDPAYANASPYQQHQQQRQQQGQFGGHNPMLYGNFGQNQNNSFQSFPPSELASNDAYGKGNTPLGNREFVAELPADVPKKEIQK